MWVLAEAEIVQTIYLRHIYMPLSILLTDSYSPALKSKNKIGFQNRNTKPFVDRLKEEILLEWLSDQMTQFGSSRSLNYPGGHGNQDGGFKPHENKTVPGH